MQQIVTAKFCNLHISSSISYNPAMDYVFTELIGKPILGSAKIITIIADNFSLLDDQARFLKATFAIPAVRQLPVEDLSKQIIQIGPIHTEIGEYVSKEKNWFVNQYFDSTKITCDKIDQDVEKNESSRSIIYINDITSFDLCLSQSDRDNRNLLKLIDRWKRLKNSFVIVLYQNSSYNQQNTLLRDLCYLSDASIKTKAIKDHYFQEIWFQPMPTHKTLVPSKVQTSYYTCKIGKFDFSPDLLCFYERNQVGKYYDPNQCDVNMIGETSQQNTDDDRNLNLIEKIALESDDSSADRNTTLPYIKAQNPEQSRIFFYPDKDDDIDEDDPDNDLNI